MIPPLIALTCGEPAGIGPEIAAAAWQRLRGHVDMVWLGDPRHLPDETPILIVDTAEQARGQRDAMPVLAHPFSGALTLGSPNAAHAQGVIDVIARAVEMAQSSTVDAICTAPIHKKALQDGAGFAFAGHTEFLAHLAGDVDVVMMLASPQLRVVPATIHVALTEVPSLLNPGLIRRVAHLTNAALRERFGIARPRIAVAGVNPHAGEGGAMGQEEQAWLSSLITALQSEGLQIFGPLSADTMFHDRARAQYDAAICMYHDQALIPIKTLDFDGGVNVTLGLPFVRTSPDHGTALDIAGKGLANPDSMVAAIRLAAEMSAT